MIDSYNHNDDQRLALEAELRAESATHAATINQECIEPKINDCCPILKLPPEISMQFFMAAFPQNSFSSWGKATPLLFGAVCRKWRELAWSSPVLWSNISFAVKRYSDTKNNLLREWLTRSGDLPLSIYLRMREPRDDSGIVVLNDTWKNTMDIIARCSERWQAIDFQLFMMFHPEICTVPTQFPLLVSMSVYLMPLFAPELPVSQVVWDAPKLRHVYIDSDIERSLILPLNQITNFTSLKVSSRRCLEILKDAPNLVKCRFEDVGGPSNRYPSVTALQLETLEIGFSCIGNWITYSLKFLESITIPAIRELSISEHSSQVLFPYWAFVPLMSRSACHLLRLSLSNMTLPPDRLAQCLSATPSLIELQLGKIGIKRETFKDLSVDGTTQNILLPNLESFVYIQGGSSRHTLDFAGLLMMATSRRHSSPLISASLRRATKLKSIRIDFSKTQIDLYLDSNGNENAPEESNEEPGSIGGNDEQNDSEAEGECTKLNRHLIARFRRLIAEGMGICILGHDNVDILTPAPDRLRLGSNDS